MKPSVRSLLAAVMCLAAPAFAQTASTLPNHPPGEWRQSLDGPWQFSTRPEPAPTDPVLTVPGNWDTHPEYSTYVGQGWYRRSFDVPADWRGKHVRLCFGAVYHAATVVLNGQEIGRHVGGYTPFEFEVTDRLTYGGVNTLTVCADNTFNRGAWWPWGGISRSVSLVANGDVRVVRQQIDAEPDLKDGSARVSVHYLLSNAGDEPQTVHLASTLDPAAAHLPGATVPIPAHGEQTADVTVLLPKAAVRLWDFDHPNLYHLTTRLTNDAGTVLHEQSDRFGIRKVEVTPEGLFLNGEKIHVCGFNRVSDSNTTGNTEPDVLVRGDVDLMKSAGAVLQRIMHYPQAPDLLDYLDEKGMLIFEEIPVWGGDDPNIKADNPLTEQWMRETITRDYNHPCIIGWSVGNELRNHYAYVHSMIDYTRTLDPHRLLTYISNSASGSGPGHDPIDFCDVAMHNTYGPDPGGLAANLRGKWPKLPVFLSEFGSNQFSESLDAEVPWLQKRWDSLAGHPYVIGVSLWTFNDYRSKMKGTPPSGNRAWGVVDVAHRPKAAYEQVRKLYSPVRALTIQGDTVSVEPRHVDEIPSYALRGYQLRWTVRDAAGAVLKEGVLALPDLRPGDPVWTGRVPGAVGEARTEVKLFSPTGYDVADTP